MSKGKLGQKGGERWRFLKEGQKGKFPGKKWLQLPLYHQPDYVQLAAGAHLELYIQSAYQGFKPAKDRLRILEYGM